jgi:thiol-disulfide isomerase/thioredoxin
MISAGYVIKNINERASLISQFKEQNLNIINIDFFTASWCPPCKMTKNFLGINNISEMSAIISSNILIIQSLYNLFLDLKKINVQNVKIILFICDIDESNNKTFVNMHKIRGVPTFVVKVNDENIFQFNAIINRESLNEFIQKIYNHFLNK